MKSCYIGLLATPGSPNVPKRKGTTKNTEKEIAWELRMDSLGRDISDTVWRRITAREKRALAWCKVMRFGCCVKGD